MTDFQTQVGRIYRNLETREEIIAYYQHEYPGVKYIHKKSGTVEQFEWKRKLSEEIQPFTRGKSGQPQGLASIQRRFQTGREGSKTSPKQAAEYKALGETLPAQPPRYGYHVEGTICMRYVSENNAPCEDRYWNYAVTGEWKNLLFATGSLDGLFNLYMTGQWEDPDPAFVLCHSDDCEIDLTVTELTEDEFRDGEYPEIATPSEKQNPIDIYFPNRKK